ncbi:2OG-Fe(II) oxygenase [Paraburkholderia oxyphila]|uniref:2OG-Fe(II) oxygenase n=1 Tax=Paraburkholderia oxyphila TaxID=614212 RepID=UPI001FE1BC76|nr:2OG-Fe(II) oxygenase [Paraburkholderia oxyphila]
MSSIQDCAGSIARTGFGTIPMTATMMESYALLVGGFSAISEETKQSYCFVDDTDGFLPFGSEYAHVKTNPDLCERFCYWHSHVSRRQSHAFSKDCYLSVAMAYEREISSLAQGTIDGVCQEFGAPSFPSIRDSSYLQLCVYSPSQLGNQRQFAQDPHEDGHLLTFIRPNLDGLVILRGRSVEPVRLLENELAVLSGSLLTQLSDCAIPAIYHAVLNAHRPRKRSSLIYFVNPDRTETFVGLRRGQRVDLSTTMNDHHTGFGNRPIAHQPEKA